MISNGRLIEIEQINVTIDAVLINNLSLLLFSFEYWEVYLITPLLIAPFEKVKTIDKKFANPPIWPKPEGPKINETTLLEIKPDPTLINVVIEERRIVLINFIIYNLSKKSLILSTTNSISRSVISGHNGKLKQESAISSAIGKLPFL